ncbi:replication initiation and membrane attachment family protein [Priestia abyssalis]|uniref:hypothetical protein n=1 Tax=Priestia abyssalis TaxID=1221450 RepID=UPI000995D0E1|nr:hypothetical protein [Priestia abyssalis]
MRDNPNILEEKERKLVQYLESCTTEEILKEAQEYTPSLRSHSSLLRKLSEMKLPQPVVNTLIYYTLATNDQKPVAYKLLTLAALCRKLNIKNAQTAITFFKLYYSRHTQISQEG